MLRRRRPRDCPYIYISLSILELISPNTCSGIAENQIFVPTCGRRGTGEEFARRKLLARLSVGVITGSHSAWAQGLIKGLLAYWGGLGDRPENRLMNVKLLLHPTNLVKVVKLKLLDLSTPCWRSSKWRQACFTSHLRPPTRDTGISEYRSGFLGDAQAFHCGPYEFVAFSNREIQPIFFVKKTGSFSHFSLLDLV